MHKCSNKWICSPEFLKVKPRDIAPINYNDDNNLSEQLATNIV